MYQFLFLVVQLWSWAHADFCLTPSGDTGDCIPQANCTPYVDLTLRFANQLLNGDLGTLHDISNYIKLSQCGVNIQEERRVCCGPFPSDFSTTSSTTTTQHPTITPQITNKSEDDVDPAVTYDSYPEPRKTCGKDASGDRIIGGTVTDLEEFPWMTILRYQKFSDPPGQLKSACGGSLVNHRYVLTAAHCLIGQIETVVGILTSVRLGEYNTNTEMDCIDDFCADPPQDIPVHSFYAHPEYIDLRRIKQGDIGLVRLSRRAKYNDYVSALCLVDSTTSKYSAGTITLVSGWGATSNGTSSAVKQKVSLPIYDSEKCYAVFSKYNLTDEPICAGGEPRKDSCKGGPLMRLSSENKWEAIGVVSKGDWRCGRKGVPGIYTPVAKYVDWLRSKILETNV